MNLPTSKQLPSSTDLGREAGDEYARDVLVAVVLLFVGLLVCSSISTFIGLLLDRSFLAYFN